MKILCLGDIHFRSSTPRARLDDYADTMIYKMDQVITIAETHGCQIILLPGDIFDTPTPTMNLLGNIIGLFSRINSRPERNEITIMGVAGQHDQRYHSTAIENTPLGVLEAAHILVMLGGKPTHVAGDIDLYGASWSEPIPEPMNTPDRFNILVMHRMIIGSKKLWEEQTDYMWSRNLLRHHKFDLIVTGDNHHFFTDRVPSVRGSRYLINCGSLMRSNVDQMKHKPSVVVYDTEERTIDIIPLNVEPAKKVLSSEVAKREKERNAELESFIDQIGDTTIAPELNFLSNLQKLSQAENIPKPIADKIDEIVNMSY